MTTIKLRRTVSGFPLSSALALACSVVGRRPMGSRTTLGASGGGRRHVGRQLPNGGTAASDVTLGATDGAVFANAGGTVTVNGTQSVGNITFNGSGYTLTGGTINMAGGFGIFGNQSATINSTLNSSGQISVASSYAGTLTLGGTDTVTGLSGQRRNGRYHGTLNSAGGPFYVGNGEQRHIADRKRGDHQCQCRGPGQRSARPLRRHGTVNQNGGTFNVTNNGFYHRGRRRHHRILQLERRHFRHGQQ